MMLNNENNNNLKLTCFPKSSKGIELGTPSKMLSTSHSALSKLEIEALFLSRFQWRSSLLELTSSSSSRTLFACPSYLSGVGPLTTMLGSFAVPIFNRIVFSDAGILSFLHSFVLGGAFFESSFLWLVLVVSSVGALLMPLGLEFKDGGLTSLMFYAFLEVLLASVVPGFG